MSEQQLNDALDESCEDQWNDYEAAEQKPTVTGIMNKKNTRSSDNRTNNMNFQDIGDDNEEWFHPHRVVESEICQ